MRNRILSITRNTIPYVKEIMPLAGSVTGCILMQQLDYWFERYPDGFYKFQDAAPGHPQYEDGKSWTEELGFTLTEFRGAFDRIGVRHKSKSDWTSAADKFQGKFYCCYTDRRAGLTFYFRNHEQLDRALDALMQAPVRSAPPQPGSGGMQFQAKPAVKAPLLPSKQPQFTGDQETGFSGNDESHFTGNEKTLFPVNPDSSSAGTQVYPSPDIGKRHAPEIGKPHSAYTETTVFTETNQRPLPQTGEGAGYSGEERGSGDDLSNLKTLFYPKANAVEIEALVGLLADCPVGDRQGVLDEVEGARQKGALRLGIVPFARGLVKASREGRFTLSLGVAIAAGRAVAAVQEHAVESARSSAGHRPPESYTDEEIAAIPSTAARERMAALKKSALENQQRQVH